MIENPCLKCMTASFCWYTYTSSQLSACTKKLVYIAETTGIDGEEFVD